MLSFFNMKGGVSKTTLVYNVGYLLALDNKRVLMVDLDPQCNLSQVCFLGNNFNATNI